MEDRCAAYLERYLAALSESLDGNLLVEQANLNSFRTMWRDREMRIRGLRMSKRFVDKVSVLEKCISWCRDNASIESVPCYDMIEILLLTSFPETF